MYHFKSFEIAASLDGEEIWTQDLMQNLLEEKQELSKDDKDLVTTEQAVEENSEGSTVDSGSGTVTCRMVYENPQPADRYAVVSAKGFVLPVPASVLRLLSAAVSSHIPSCR